MRLFVITTILFFTFCCTRAQEVQSQKIADKKGVASFYHDKFVGRKTATGEVFKNDKFTAACNKLKLGSYVKVTNLSNGNIVYVRINDRMAATNNRLIDLARIAAEDLGFKENGIAKVKVEIVPANEGKTGILAQNEKDNATINQL